MAKLVLYLPDGSLHDILLDKERLTIGRRPDNDVCLPYPAVSGEHAAVVTILADSFLEDLGSTNGTLVNGKAVVKHFLRDNDHIDIGRQRLVYFGNDDAQADPLPPDLLRREVRGLHDQVQRVLEAREEKRKPAAPPEGALLPDEDLMADIEAASQPDDPQPASAGAPAETAPARRPARPASPVAARLASTWSTDSPAAGGADTGWTPVASAPPAPPVRAEAPPPIADPVLGYRLRVLSGPSAGRELVLNRPELSVGRVGSQVARVLSDGSGWRLAPLEGADPLELNGLPVAPEGVRLAAGDRFRVAGTDLVFEPR